MRQGDISLRVIQITDSHIQAQANGELYGVNVDASLNAVLQHAQQHHWPADFMLATGDLVQDNGGGLSTLSSYVGAISRAGILPAR